MIQVIGQKPIIHNRHAYNKGSAGYPKKCYEWSHSVDSYETLLEFGVAMPDMAYASDGTLLPGLVMIQNIFVDVFAYGKSGDECAKGHLTMRELFPLLPMKYQVVEDPHAFADNWIDDCATTKQGSNLIAEACHWRWEVNTNFMMGAAKTNGVPGVKTQGDKAVAVYVKSTQTATGSGESETKERSYGLEKGITWTYVEHKWGQYSYDAEIVHCHDLSTLRGVPDDRDIPAGVRDENKLPDESIRRLFWDRFLDDYFSLHGKAAPTSGHAPVSAVVTDHPADRVYSRAYRAPRRRIHSALMNSDARTFPAVRADRDARWLERSD